MPEKYYMFHVELKNNVSYKTLSSFINKNKIKYLKISFSNKAIFPPIVLLIFADYHSAAAIREHLADFLCGEIIEGIDDD